MASDGRQEIETASGPDPADVVALFDTLGAEEDEVAVLSAVYQPVGEELVLRHASLLIGPAEMAKGPWAKWRGDSGPQLRQLFSELSKLSAEGLIADASAEDGTQFVAGRAAMDIAAARQFVVDACTDGKLSAVGDLPAATTGLVVPNAMLRVFPRLWTPAARLAAMSVRPAQGFLFEVAEPLDPLDAGDNWTFEGVTCFDSAWSLLGLAMSRPAHRLEPALPQGILVGRLERRAWFNDVRGDGDFNLYELHVGREAGRIDIADLEIELEEWTGVELAASRRLLLGELALGKRAGETRITIALPTLGRGMAHSARLYDRDGALLDRTDRSKLIGDARETPTLADRLQRMQSVENDYRGLLMAGVEERIITNTSKAIDVVTNNLADVPGEIFIMDPFFGKKADDWKVLSGISNPIKVLGGYETKSAPSSLSNADVRRWKHPHYQQAPPYHDRVYLWEGGGLSVGTSPSGLGKRDARVDRFGAIESEVWRTRFSGYWNGPDVVTA